MVSVPVPQLQRIAPSGDLPQNDRIRSKARDQSANILNRTNQVAALGERAIKIKTVYEDNKIDSLSSEAKRKYAEWNAEKLGKLKADKSDPTDSYAQYDLEEKAFFDKLISDRPDLNDRVKKGYTANLAGYQSANRVAVLKQRGFQKEVYEHNLFTSDMKINGNEMAINAGNITKGDRTSYIPFDNGLNYIWDQVSKNALRNGTATEVEDDAAPSDHEYADHQGQRTKVNLKPAAKIQLGKQMTAQVTNAVSVLIASGKHAEARDMMEDDKYKIYINGNSKATFEKRLAKGETENKARVALAGIQNKSEEEQMQAIKAIKDPEVKEKASQMKATQINQMNTMRSDRFKKNYNRLAGHVIDRMSGPNPFYGLSDLQADKTYQATWENLDPAGKTAILDLINPPKTSKPKDIEKVQDRLFKDQFKGMDPMEFSQLVSPLSESERKRYRKTYEKTNTPSSSGSSFSARLNFGNKLIEDTLVDLGDFKLSGKTLDQKSRKLKAEVRREYADYLLGFETMPTEREIVAHMDPFIAHLRAKDIIDAKSISFGERLGSFFGGDNSEDINKFRKKPKTSDQKLKDLQSEMDAQLKGQDDANN